MSDARNCKVGGTLGHLTQYAEIMYGDRSSKNMPLL